MLVVAADWRVQPLGQRLRLVRVGGGQKPRAEVGLADPAARVDARPEEVAEVIGGRRAVHPRHVGQCGKADPFAARHHLQPLPHQRPVDPDQRRDIGHRGQRDEIEKRHQVGAGHALAPPLPVRLDQHQEHDRGGAEMAEFAAFILPVRVDHGEGGGQRLAAKMVVEDDDIRPLGGGDGVMAEGAAIDTDDEVVLSCKPRHRGHVRAIAFVDPVGDIERGIPPRRPQPGQEQRGRCTAVDVVIGEDGDPLAVRDRRQEPCCRPLHVLQAARIGQEIAKLRIEEAPGLVRADAARDEKAREREGQAGLLRHRLGETVRLGAGADPAAPGQRCVDAKECGHALSSGSGRRRHRQRIGLR